MIKLKNVKVESLVQAQDPMINTVGGPALIIRFKLIVVPEMKYFSTDMYE